MFIIFVFRVYVYEIPEKHFNQSKHYGLPIALVTIEQFLVIEDKLTFHVPSL